MSTRESFDEKFGEDAAKELEVAAYSHATDMSQLSGDRGSDEFKWVLITCISFQCAERHAKYHGISILWETLKSWIKWNVDFRDYDGGFDALSLFAGAYNEYLPDKEEKVH